MAEANMKAGKEIAMAEEKKLAKKANYLLAHQSDRKMD